MPVPVLTIDGPSGAGKGTVSRLAAKRLGWHYLDSGAIYRALGLAAVQAGLDLHDSAGVCGVAAEMQLHFDCGDVFTVRLNGLDVTTQLAGETAGKNASLIAADPAVRQALFQKQMDFRRPPGLVADGRDMGSVVFPDAAYKVFLTASSEQRALRRYKQLKEKGIDANLIQIRSEIEQRDQRDRERAVAPLVAPEGALYLDSSDLSIEQALESVLNLVRGD